MGTTKFFRKGDLVTTGHDGQRHGESSPDHVYFTSDPRLAAQYAGMRDDPRPESTRDDRYSVYRVEPTGPYEPDPRHSGEIEGYDKEPNYRSAHPLRVLGRMPYTHSQIRDADL